jgi:hypothetical protein
VRICHIMFYLKRLRMLLLQRRMAAQILLKICLIQGMPRLACLAYNSKEGIMGTSAELLKRGMAFLGFGSEPNRMTACAGNRDVRAFIENGTAIQRKRWIAYICGGFIIVGSCAFLISLALGLGKASEISGADHQPTAQSEERPAPGKTSLLAPQTKIQALANSLSGSEAEASICPVILSNQADRQQIKPAMLIEQTPTAGNKMRENAVLAEEVKNLFSIVETACENEDKDKLVAILDEEGNSLHSSYIRTIERMFRSFDNISVSFSKISMEPVNEQEVLVKAHVKVEGAFAFTGGWKTLSNKDQSFLLRRQSGSNWKLCSIQ